MIQADLTQSQNASYLSHHSNDGQNGFGNNGLQGSQNASTTHIKKLFLPFYFPQKAKRT
jgi:hypothetical protein